MLPFRRPAGCAHGGQLGSPELPCWRCQASNPPAVPRRRALPVQPTASPVLDAQTGATSLFRLSGRVRATQLRTRQPVASGIARGVAGLVFAAFVLTHLETIMLWLATQFFWLIVVGVLLTMFGMGWIVGVGAGIFGFLLAVVARMLPVPRPRDPAPHLRVRLATDAGDREFDLPGHEVGFQVGDWVQATTLPSFGARQALAARNVSTSTVYRARSGGGVLLPALLIVLLLSIW